LQWEKKKKKKLLVTANKVGDEIQARAPK